MSGNSILFLTYWYPNKINKSFGIFIKRHAHAIKLNNEVKVVYVQIDKGSRFFQKDTRLEVDEKGIETHIVHLSSVFPKLLYLFPWLHKRVLKKYLKDNPDFKGVNIVHSNVLYPAAIVGHTVAREFNCKHVISEHWTKIDKFFSRSLYRFTARKVLDSASAITCVSRQLRATVSRYTVNSQTHVVPNVVDSGQFFFDSAMKKNDVFTFIAVANWSQFKNPFYFLDAMERLCKEGLMKDFKLTMIGEGDQIKRIQEKGYSFQIAFLGTLTASEICKELNKSHAFVHGSDFETFSVIIAEALMCGLPSVVSPVGIAPEVINGSNGYIADNTLEDWRNKLLLVYGQKYNYQAIADQLKYKFSEEHIGKLFDEVYSALN